MLSAASGGSGVSMPSDGSVGEDSSSFSPVLRIPEFQTLPFFPPAVLHQHSEPEFHSALSANLMTPHEPPLMKMEPSP